MSAFGSRLPGAGFDAGTALAGGAVFAVPALLDSVFAEGAFAGEAFAEEAFAAEAFVGEVFAGAAFAAGLVTLLAAAAAFAAGAFTAGLAAVFSAAVLAVASVPAAGFETALADAFTGVFDAFATHSSLAIPVRLFLGRPCRAHLQIDGDVLRCRQPVHLASLSMYCLYRRRCKSCPDGKAPKDLPSKIFPHGNLWNAHLLKPWIGWKRPRHRHRQTADQ
ncbi:hypothetical protein M5D98_00605 [Mesorhizobium opportunistum]|uniref:hypothetical protein n=1 Tax=Mesorhizobium opportunistum TaxID=593909 RepID=UPI002018E1E1|nr:hypothetical protein [Mesorhizobium opportunistum]UQS64914.1 hypothetical protein M5D98_00605 [Mesorhizobium opportunistum]